MNATDGTTIIGAHTVVRGELGGTGNLVIEGQVDGKVIVPGSRVTVGQQGKVRAGILAHEIVIAGSVHGDLTATVSVRLEPTAIVVGNISSPRFIMEDLAMLRGHVGPEALPETAGNPPAGSGSLAELNTLLDDAAAMTVTSPTP